MKQVRNEQAAFTIVEVMVAMVVLAIGLLGMAGMTLMVIKGGTDASRMTYATNLASDKLEALKDIEWSDLGSRACTSGDASTYGCSNHDILVENGLNQHGETSIVTGALGPFPFIRKWVVCSEDYSDIGSNSTDRSSYCTTDTSQRPEGLECNADDTLTSEKKIKIVVGWRDKGGRCHKVSMESIMVDL